MGEVFTMTSLLIWVGTRISERYLGDRGGRTLGLYYFLNHMSSGFLYLLHANFYPRFFCLSKRFIVDIYSPFCSDNIINFSLTLSPFGWSRHNIPSITIYCHLILESINWKVPSLEWRAYDWDLDNWFGHIPKFLLKLLSKGLPLFLVMWLSYRKLASE